MSPNSRKQKSLRRIERAAGRMLSRKAMIALSLSSIRDLDTIADWLEHPKLCWACRCPKDKHRCGLGTCESCGSCNVFTHYPDGVLQPAPED